MKTKFLFTLLAILVASVSGYWSYLAGVSASQEVNAMIHIPIIKKQHECINAGDMECISVTNAILASTTSAQIRALFDSGMPHTLDDEGDDFIKWSEGLTTSP